MEYKIFLENDNGETAEIKLQITEKETAERAGARIARMFNAEISDRSWSFQVSEEDGILHR